MLNICSACCKDTFLKQYVLHNGSRNKRCIICKDHRNPSVDAASDQRFVRIIRFLIRFYFSEAEYAYFGSVEGLMYSENPILNHNLLKDDEFDWLVVDNDKYHKFDHFMELLLEDAFGENGGIPLYNGPSALSKRQRLVEGYLPFEKLMEAPSEICTSLEKRLQEENFFLIEREILDSVSSIKKHLQRSVDSGCTYYRARIGYDRCVKYFDIDGEPGNREILVPHTGSEIAAPPPPKCTAGRLNRPGVSYLYLATDPETAVAEVRPHPGHLVSIGQFTLKRDIWVADLRELDRTQFIDSDEMIEMFLFLHNVSKQLSMPVTPEEKNKYLLTQFFADIVRQSDFDGILYKSSVSEKGDNLVLFDPKLAEFVPSGSRLFKVEKVKYDMVPEKFDPEADYSDEGYVVYENGKWFF